MSCVSSDQLQLQAFSKYGLKTIRPDALAFLEELIVAHEIEDDAIQSSMELLAKGYLHQEGMPTVSIARSRDTHLVWRTKNKASSFRKRFSRRSTSLCRMRLVGPWTTSMPTWMSTITYTSSTRSKCHGGSIRLSGKPLRST